MCPKWQNQSVGFLLKPILLPVPNNGLWGGGIVLGAFGKQIWPL